MRQLAMVLFLSVFATSYGCQSNSNQPASSTASASDASPTTASAQVATPNPSPANAQSKVDACTLLNSAEVQAQQGEPVNATKASQQRGGQLITDLCYYELPTPSNSVSLALTYAASGKREELREFWENTFVKAEEKGNEKKKPGAPKAEKEREAQRERGGEEEEEGAKPEKISGLGDEAFWLASRVGGALYVLKGDRYFRISIGGAGNNETKLNKSRNLAQKALARL